jgi:hypothetical protein
MSLVTYEEVQQEVIALKERVRELEAEIISEVAQVEDKIKNHYSSLLHKTMAENAALRERCAELEKWSVEHGLMILDKRTEIVALGSNDPINRLDEWHSKTKFGEVER